MEIYNYQNGTQVTSWAVQSPAEVLKNLPCTPHNFCEVDLIPSLVSQPRVLDHGELIKMLCVVYKIPYIYDSASIRYCYQANDFSS